MTTYLGKGCSFCLPRVPFVNCRQFMYLVISLLVLRAGYGIWLYQFLIIAYLFTISNNEIYVWIFMSVGQTAGSNFFVNMTFTTLIKYNTTPDNISHFIQTGSHTIFHWIIWTCILKSTAVAIHAQNVSSAKIFCMDFTAEKKIFTTCMAGN